MPTGLHAVGMQAGNKISTIENHKFQEIDSKQDTNHKF